MKEATQAEINIGMIGHVDHGKTSLVQALTGKWADTHSEELKKGISIRLGYADASFYRCENCKGSESYSNKEKCPNCGKKGTLLRKVSFVDAPGHETLMATMLSGASLMHGAILVIAANEHCPQPRTVEHLMALSITDTKDIIVVQNKIDLVSKEAAEENFKQIKGFLKDYGYESAPIIPIAAHFGTNVDLLIETIEKTIKTPKFDSSKELKMYVVRSFDVNKPGTKPSELNGGGIGGSILQGELIEGSEIEITPGLEDKNILTKAVALSVSEGRIRKAKPGGLIAVQTLLDPNLTKSDLMRGQIVSKTGKMPAPTRQLRLEVYALKRLLSKSLGEVKVNDLLVLTVGTMTGVGNVVKQSGKNEFEVALKNSVVIEKGQKVAISKRDGSSWRLAAYGISK